MKLDKSHNPTILRIDLGMGSSVRFIHKLAKFLIKTSDKIHKLKIYNEEIEN